MKINFLEAKVPLAKTFTKTPDGIKKTSYPNAFLFTSHEEEVKTPEDLFHSIKKHANKGHCLLKGELRYALVNESRAGSTDPATETRFLVLDIDGLDLPDGTTFDNLLHSDRRFKDLRNVSYVLVQSASSGITGNGMRVHAYFLLAKPIKPETLKLWTIELNLECEILNNSLQLTRTKNTLKYPLDTVVNQNDRLMFDAPPVCRGFKDPIKDRIQLIEKKNNFVRSTFKHSPKTLIEQAKRKKINELRKAENLPARRSITEKIHKGVLVENVSSTKPEITGIKQDRGFVYMNLNGGDSWGYYHPITDPTYLYNFKGEPTYLIKDLLPGYYPEAVENAKQAKEDFAEERTQELIDENNEADTLYMTVVNVKQNELMAFEWSEQKETLEVYRSLSSTVLRNFQRNHGIDTKEPLEEWSIVFDPTQPDLQVDMESKVLNLYKPSSIMKEARKRKTFELTPNISHAIAHALGNDAETVEYFINWIAYIVQTGKKSGVSWVAHGGYGSGKSTLYEKILVPILGEHNCIRLNLHTLTEDKFNGQLRTAQLAFIDEADTSSIREAKKLSRVLKEIITEPTLTVREMHRTEITVPSYLNILIATNEINTLPVPPKDRRYSFGIRQEEPISASQARYDAIANELVDFTAFLLNYNVDITKATKPIENEAKKTAQELSMTNTAATVNAILTGDFDYLLENAPHEERPHEFLNATRRALPTYREALREIYDTHKQGKISRDALETLFFYLTDVGKTTPMAFTRWANLQGLRIERFRLGNERIRGLQNIKWNIKKEHTMMLKRLELNSKEKELRKR